MRRIFTTDEALASGVTLAQLLWDAKTGVCVRAGRSVYAEGPDELSVVEKSIALAKVTGGCVSGVPAGTLLGLDSMEPTKVDFTVARSSSNARGARRRELSPEQIITVEGVRVTSGLQTLLDVAPAVNDLVWEHALESALFRRLTSIAAVEAALAELSRARTPGVTRIRRVLALRPVGAPPTESLLETLMVQLARAVDAPVPTRQVRIFNEWDEFVARVDLCWPELGVFLELDGQHHKGQPVYDANRETRVVAATGWLCGRFTWDEVRCNPNSSGRRLLRVLEQARRRPLTHF